MASDIHLSMNFLEKIFAQLESTGETVILRELGGGETQQAASSLTGRELLGMIAMARAFLAAQGLKKGERCALLAHNSVHWVAMDLAIMAEGMIVVPLYARQAPAELVAMMKDCSPALIFCGDAALRDGIVENWLGGAAAGAVEGCVWWRLPPFAKNAKDGAPGRLRSRSLLFIRPVLRARRRGLSSPRAMLAICWAALRSGLMR